MTDGNLPLEGRTVWMVRAARTPVLVAERLVEVHPTRPGEVVLRNVGLDDWVMTPEGGSAVTVPSKRRLGVRTMIIDFGSVKGRISVD